MSNIQKLSACCALVNDHDDVILHEIIDHLGLLESGGLEAHQKKIGSETVPFHTVRLDTKYYTYDLPLLSCHSLERFKAICAAERNGALEVFAVIFCATRKQLTENFLGLVSKWSSSLEKAEMKAIVLRENETHGATKAVNSNDDLLNKFALSRGIEIIRIGRNKTNCTDDIEEDGLNGIPRLVEAIEVVRWPSMKMKPNPLNQQAHRDRLKKYINSESCSDINNTSFADLVYAPFPGVALQGSSKEYGHHSIEKETSNNPSGSDYPDSEDEEAILEWFDRPRQDNITHFPNIPSPKNKVTDMQQCQGTDDSDGPFVWKNMSEVRLGTAQLPSKERVDVSEGITYEFLNRESITYDFLKAISSNKRGDHKKD